MEDEFDQNEEVDRRPNIPIGVQLLLFLTLWFMGTYLGQFLFMTSLDIATDYDLNELDWDLARHRIPLAALHGFFGLLIPALYFKRITRVRIWDYIKVHFRLEGKMLLICLGSLIVGLYAMEFLSVVNLNAVDYISDGYLQEIQASLENVQANLFLHDSFGQYIATILVFALLPAIGEEFIFRGILFNKLMDTSSGNLHFSAIISGLIFAAIHMQAMNILPIAFMGIGFAYLYHYSKNLTYPILVHFLVNAIQISSVFFLGDYRLY